MTTVLELALAIAERSVDAEAVQIAVGLIESIVGADVVLELTGFGNYGEIDHVQTLARAYLSPDPDPTPRLRELADALANSPAAERFGELQVRELTEESWEDAWKQHYHPLRVGRHLVISPTWEQPDTQPNDQVIWLDPGMAFGTGGHPSTTLILELLEKYMQPGMRMLDVGTGSGILAIAGCKLGAAAVIATDIDPTAVKVAGENSRVNQVDDRIAIVEGSVPGDGQYDLVCANILADVIAELILHEQLTDRLAPDGILLLSGIIAPHSHMVELALAASNMQIIDQQRQDDWLALAARLR
ncbi:MAG: 50S ribosomal protein L11 methyltransferase [Caldilineales bacterium]|nr:50S ribosomal protein L11 methyltransferase [Caldilineales bacterium]